jgi:hypothetical protein
MIIMIKCEVDHSNSKISRRRPRVARPTRTYSGIAGGSQPPISFSQPNAFHPNS